ncbi:hypothetical protein ACQ4PT_065944 [Festuca glaucescens]
MASSSGAGGSSTAQEPELAIDDLLQHLDLREDELDDVVIVAEEVKEYQKATRWMAIGKVHTSRNFSVEALFGKMKAVWNLSREPICREAGENLFVFQMHCLGDWKKVVHQGPWTFRGWAVMIQDYDGKEDPRKISFDGLYRKVHIVDDLARRIGKAREVQMAPKLYYEGNYVRIRVLVSVDSPLTRVVSLNVEGEGKKRLFVKYEKVPYFCKHCGLMGHNHEECGDGVWTARQLQFGDFMMAVRRATPPPMEPHYMSPRGRGRGSGRGFPTAPRKRSSQEASLDDEDDLNDSASSPVKTVPMETVDDGVSGARKALNLDDKNSEKGPAENTPAIPENSGAAPPPPPSYTDPWDRSKLRKTNATNNDLATSAASFEEDRRAQ